MKNVRAERFIWIFVFSSAGAWLTSAWIAAVSFADVWAMVKLLPNVVSFDVLVFGLFAKWLWKWRLFQGWLVPFPNLNGIWIGTVSPVEEGEHETRAIPAVLVIDQSFLSISCVMDTDEMTSSSYSANFLIDDGAQIRKLVYIYTSRPRVGVAARSPVHDGTTTLNIDGSPPKKLRGEYWNARRRVGEIDLKFLRRRRHRDISRDLIPHDN
jgi:SMODS-associating 2TM, beta-strand rich effector domain